MARNHVALIRCENGAAWRGEGDHEAQGLRRLLLWNIPAEGLKAFRQSDIRSGPNRYGALVRSVRAVATEHGLAGP